MSHRDQMTGHLDDYRCSAKVRGSFQETAPRKTAENTVKQRNSGAGSVTANNDSGESLVVVTTLTWCINGQNHFVWCLCSKGGGSL